MGAVCNAKMEFHKNTTAIRKRRRQQSKNASAIASCTGPSNTTISLVRNVKEDLRLPRSPSSCSPPKNIRTGDLSAIPRKCLFLDLIFLLHIFTFLSTSGQVKVSAQTLVTQAPSIFLSNSSAPSPTAFFANSTQTVSPSPTFPTYANESIPNELLNNTFPSLSPSDSLVNASFVPTIVPLNATSPPTSTPPFTNAPNMVTFAPTAAPTFFPSHAPTFPVSGSFLEPIQVHFVIVASTFQRRALTFWENTTSQFIEDYWNRKNETLQPGGGPNEITLEGPAEDVVSGVTAQTRFLSQRRQSFRLSSEGSSIIAVEAEDGSASVSTESTPQTNSTDGSLSVNGLTLIYANNVQYTTANLAYSPEMIVTEPFRSLNNRQALASRLKKYNETSDFMNVTFVTFPVILHSSPENWPSAYFVSQGEAVTRLTVELRLMTGFMNSSAVVDWQDAMSSHIEAYWTDAFFQSTGNRVFNLQVTTDFNSQSAIYEDPGSVSEDGYVGTTIIYSQFLRYDLLGEINTLEDGAYSIASMPFNTEELQGQFAETLRNTGNPAFESVIQVSPVLFQTPSPTSAPSTRSPTEQPSSQPSSMPSPAPPPGFNTSVNAAAVVTPLVICAIFAGGLCYYQLRKSRQKREKQREEAARAKARQEALEKEGIAQYEKDQASKVAAVAAVPVNEEDVEKARPDLTQPNGSAQDPQNGEAVEGVSSPEHFLTPQQFTVDGDESKSDEEGAEEGGEGETSEGNDYRTPTSIRRFPTATLDTAFLTADASTMSADAGTMMMTVTPINDYVEDEDDIL